MLNFLLGQKSNEPSIFNFSLSADLDYKKFLETRSHFDQVNLRIDNQTREILGSNQDVIKSINHFAFSSADGLKEIERSTGKTKKLLEDGFETLRKDIQQVRVGIDQLRIATETGFRECVSGLFEINSNLRELINVVKTPEQTWAKEQYDIARNCLKNGLRREALEYCEKSIFGDSNHAGFKVEPSFHYLHGSILIGDPSEEGIELLDIDRGINAFELSVRYCGNQNPRFKTLSLIALGWAHLCNRDIAQSLEEFKRAIAIDETSAMAHFFHAKAKICMGDQDFQASLKRALLIDANLATRALLDQDFLNKHDETLRIIEETRKEIREDFVDTIRLRGRIAQNKELVSFLEQHRITEPITTSLAFERLKVSESAPILTLFRWNLNLEEAIDSIRNAQLSADKKVRELGERLKARRIERSAVDDGTIGVFSFVLGTVGFFLGGTIGVQNFTAVDEAAPFGSLWPLVYFFLIPVLAVGLAALGAWAPRVISSINKEKVRKENEKALATAKGNASELMEEWERLIKKARP